MRLQAVCLLPNSATYAKSVYKVQYALYMEQRCQVADAASTAYAAGTKPRHGIQKRVHEAQTRYALSFCTSNLAQQSFSGFAFCRGKKPAYDTKAGDAQEACRSTFYINLGSI